MPGMKTNPEIEQLAAGDGSCARLVANANQSDDGLRRVGEQLIRMADQDPAIEAELFELVAADLELVLGLQDLVRYPWTRETHVRWLDLARDRLDRPPAPSSPAIAALASLHEDGRVRERALAVMTEPEAFMANAHQLMPFLVLRTTDWAAPVREAARARLKLFLDRQPELLLFPAARTALRLATWTRSGFALDQVRASLAAASDEVFAGFLASDQPQLRRLAAAVPGRIADGDLVRRARVETDRVARLCFAEAAVRAAQRSGRLQDIEPLLTSAHSDVRVVAVTAFARAGLDLRVADHLGDPDKAVRAIAGASARRCGIDVARRYRELIRVPTVRPGVLYGLADTADRAPDGEIRRLIEERLADPRSRVRVAAIGALYKVGGFDRDRLLGLLRDPAGRVVRAAAHRLEPDAASLDPGPLLALVADPDRTPPARNNICTLVRKHSPEAAFAAVLTAFAGPDQALAHRAAYDLRWTTVISVLGEPSWLRSGRASQHYLNRFTIDQSIVPDLPERFAAARPHIDPKKCEAIEEMFDLYWH